MQVQSNTEAGLPSATRQALVELFNAGRLRELEVQAQAVLAQYPAAGLPWKLLGAALQGQGKDALEAFRKAAELMPGDAEAHHSLGVALQQQGRLEEAAESFVNALNIAPRFAEAHYNLGNVMSEAGQLDAAAICYRNALGIDPGLAVAHSNLGAILQELGQLDEALDCCRRTLELDPGLTVVRSNLLCMLNYVEHTRAHQLEEARKYGRLIAQQVTARFTAWQCDPQPGRLRVGMVSGDLRNHPVGYALASLFAQLDPERIELYAYSTNLEDDSYTALLKPHFTAWKVINDMAEETVARLIHDDGIHVLLDLSGHSERNRLPVFAWKPAPVQASWLGYFSTTGVAEMDYLMTSEVAIPRPERDQCSETVWYLPDTWMCFTPPDLDLAVAPLPAEKNGHLTFGCFQRLDKLGDECLAAWAQILSALPTARMLIACKLLGDEAVAAKFVARLQQQGIDPARVELRGSAASRVDYLKRYAEVDMMLDTFPYPGVTTSCEAMWMGVPTLTLAGHNLCARQGAGVLVPAGLGDWVTQDRDGYVARAIALASDTQQLAKLRAGMRAQVKASPLFDAERFARNFETAMWAMWQAHVQGGKQSAPADTDR